MGLEYKKLVCMLIIFCTLTNSVLCKKSKKEKYKEKPSESEPEIHEEEQVEEEQKASQNREEQVENPGNVQPNEINLMQEQRK